VVGALGRGGGVALAGAGVLATGGGVNPTSGGTGGGASLPSSAGSDAIPAIAAATTAAARPTVPHLICLPATSR
jgi:hypothetical protein